MNSLQSPRTTRHFQMQSLEHRKAFAGSSLVCLRSGDPAMYARCCCSHMSGTMAWLLTRSPFASTAAMVQLHLSHVRLLQLRQFEVSPSLISISTYCSITDFILSNGIAKSSKDVGFYAGWIESAYSCAVLAGLYPASLISDAYGRKTTVLIGITAGAVATIAFGFARNFYALVAIRFAVGLSISLTPA